MEISVSLDPSSGKDFKEYVNYLNGINGISIHCDVMDGIFVPRVAIPMEEYTHLMKNTVHDVDVHLMIDKPNGNLEQFLAKVVLGKIRSVCFHIEATDVDGALKLLQKIKLSATEAGIAIDQDTNPDQIDERIYTLCDVVTIMSIKCGASGRPFNPEALDKVRYIRAKYPNIRIIIDGGINESNAQQVKEAGVQTAVMGSAIYNAEDREKKILQISSLTSQ